MSPKSIVQTPDAPAAIGPYHQAVIAGGFAFCSGQIGLDPKSGALVAGGVEAQAERAIRNLLAVVAKAGARPEDVVKTTLYLTDIADFAAVNQVYQRFFTGEFPARATVGVASLPKGALVEIDCIAVRP